jgi:outer membrane biosynthesis protein TonB
MALPSLKPTADAQIPQRCHTDPPGLWFYVTFGSVIIHLLGFGILRLLLMGNGQGLQSQQNIIPVDLITVAPTNTSSNQINPAPSSVTTRNPVSTNLPVTRKLDPNRNRLVISTPTPTPTPPVISPEKQVKTPISFPSPNQPSAKPIQKPEVQPSSSQNQQPNPQTTTTQPVWPSNNTPKPEPSATTSSGGTPSTPSTPGTQTNQNPSSSQSGGGVISPLGKLQDRIESKQPIIHPDDPNYNDKLAVLIEGKTQISGGELKQLGIKLDQVVELKVGVVIETNGTATVLPKITEAVRGNLSKDAAVALASKVVQQLRFQPTLMAGKPVPREYYIPVTITPNPK